MKLQDRIVQIRKERGLSQEGLAERLGISRQAVAKWESGVSYPDVDNLIALSSIFQISIDSMLKSEEDGCNAFHPKNKRVLSDAAVAFLCKAKKETYAGEANRVEACRPCSYDYRYCEGEYVYYDSYFGGERFTGEEVLYEKEQPVYSMNYSGRVLGEGFSGNFLKEALLLVPEEAPFRGPGLYRNGDYTYHCLISGDLEWFQGYEEIFRLDQRIYECCFHGGIIK